MEVRVIEGPLAEAPTPDASGMQRTAFGEFVGPGGERASYALGWTAGPDDHVGHLTVGIGVGNPGGGTFHAAVFEHEGSHAFGLVDEPFADVPQGGPDLTADEARAHEDLPFIWCVADRVMERDRRAWWMRHWLLETRAIATRQVLDLDEPVLLVINDDDDELWQLIGVSDAGTDAAIVHLHHAVDEDPTLAEVLDLEPGESAVRTGVGAPWERGRG